MESLTPGPELENSQGHFRPRQRALPPGPLPLRPRKLTSGPKELQSETDQLRSWAAVRLFDLHQCAGG